MRKAMRSAFQIVPHSRSLRSVLPLHRYKAHKVFYHLAADDQAPTRGRDSGRDRDSAQHDAAPHNGAADTTDSGEGQPSRSGKRRRRSSRSRGAQGTDGAARQSAEGQGQGSSHEGEN